MKEQRFINLRIIVTFLLLVVFITPVALSQEKPAFSLEQLTGRGNADLVGKSYTSTMHGEAADALSRMQAAALKEGIRIEVVSAYRSFERQKTIYEQKYRRYLKQGMSPAGAIEKVIEYSTIPGTSRHHWGTDLDLIDGSVKRPANVLDPANYYGEGVYCRLKEWLVEHAQEYGFYEVYTRHPGRKGFKHEPWHYSYAPVSVPMLRAYRELDIGRLLRDLKVEGSEYFTQGFIEKYTREHILDINPLLK